MTDTEILDWITVNQVTLRPPTWETPESDHWLANLDEHGIGIEDRNPRAAVTRLRDYVHSIGMTQPIAGSHGRVTSV